MKLDMRSQRPRTRPGYLTVNETLDRVPQITYRQLDYWLRCGSISAAVSARGSGSRRQFTEEQIPMLRLCGCISHLGLHRVTEIVSEVWATIEGDPDLLAADVLFLTERGLTNEPGFGFCIPKSEWVEPVSEHAVA